MNIRYTQGTSPDQDLFTLNDTQVRRWEVDLLNENQWLNDSVLGICGEIIKERVDPNMSFDIVDCLLTECVKAGDIEMLSRMNLDSKDIVCFVVNDSNTLDVANTGSHWSLLVYRKETERFSVYSSTNIGEYRNGPQQPNHGIPMLYQNIVRNLQPLLQYRGQPLIRIPNCSKQNNYSDCGVYVIEYMCSILNPSDLGRDEPRALIDLPPDHIRDRRIYWKRMILSCDSQRPVTDDEMMSGYEGIFGDDDDDDDDDEIRYVRMADKDKCGEYTSLRPFLRDSWLSIVPVVASIYVLGVISMICYSLTISQNN